MVQLLNMNLFLLFGFFLLVSCSESSKQEVDTPEPPTQREAPKASRTILSY